MDRLVGFFGMVVGVLIIAVHDQLATSEARRMGRNKWVDDGPGLQIFMKAAAIVMGCAWVTVGLLAVLGVLHG